MEIEKLYLLSVCQALLKQSRGCQVIVGNHVAPFWAVSVPVESVAFLLASLLLVLRQTRGVFNVDCMCYLMLNP